jgi:aspartate/methionine/tyrosine aminotransferase
MKDLARRLDCIQPFHVMDILARARALEAAGRLVIHMEIGEPDFPTVESIVAAGIDALEAGKTHYTPALGLSELRKAIATSYAPVAIDPDCVLVTPGATGALMLVFAALLNAGDEVLLADPGYPCNCNFVYLFGGRPVGIPVNAETGYQLTADLIDANWSERTKLVLVASPSNPTGTLVADAEMARIVERVAARGGVLVVDEIYHGLTYETEAHSVLGKSQNVFVLNSFSKYYGMTGWRLGWMVAPLEYVEPLDRLAQNMFLAANTPAQYAALAAFRPEVRAILEARRREFQRRRDYLLPALRALGFDIPITPQGAFYLYADCSRLGVDAETLSRDLLEQEGVAVTPGRDFGTYRAEQHLRFSYANTLDNLREGVRRIGTYLQARSAGP